MNQVQLSFDEPFQKFDIAVIGGGTAGAIAAIAAGREGKNVVLCEREYALGGTSTLAQVNPRMTNKMTPEVCNSSVLKELQRKLEADGYGYHQQWFSPQMIGAYLEKEAMKYNVKILYGACFLSAKAEGGKIKQGFFKTAEGIIAISAECFIDATGGAEVAAVCGCDYESGNQQGENQPMTLRFAIGNVNIPKLKAFAESIGLEPNYDEPWFEMVSLWSYHDNKLTALFEQAVKDGVIERRDGNYFQAFYCKCAGEGIIWCNCPEASFVRNANKSESITEMILYSRQAAIRISAFLKGYVGGFEESFIHSFASIPGIRESRRIVGQYYLTLEDYLQCRQFDDAVAQTAYPVDVHGEDLGELVPMGKNEYYEIPFRCMLPKNGPRNLIVTGRCISASFPVQGSLRIQPVCIALGEAAGIGACAYCDENEMDGRKIREKMIQYGGEFR